MLTKFSNLEDFFKFLEVKRTEIQADYELIFNKKDGIMTKEFEETFDDNMNEDELFENDMDCFKKSQLDGDNIPPAIQKKEFSLNVLDFDNTSDSELIQIAWSTSLETPQTKQSRFDFNISTDEQPNDTTLIMEHLNLNESEFDCIEEIIEKYDRDLEQSIIDDYEEEEQVGKGSGGAAQMDPLGLDLLSFPMSQFPADFDNDLEDELMECTSEKDSFELLNEDEFDFNFSISQVPPPIVQATHPFILEDTYGFIGEFSGFKTGRGTALPPPSSEAMKRARSLVELDENQCDDNAQQESIIPMFSTAKGNVIQPPSEAAIKKARNLIEEFDEKENDVLDFDSAEPLELTSFPSFSTAKGKILPPPSKEAIQRANRLIEDSISHYEPSETGPIQAVGFSTGRGKALPPPSKEAIDRASKLIDEPVSVIIPTAKTIGFSTGRGKVLPPPSEEALQKAACLIDDIQPNPPKQPQKAKNLPLAPLKPKTVNIAPPTKPFSLSSAWKRSRNVIVKPPPSKPITTIKVEPLKLFDLDTTGIQRFKLKEFFKTSPNLSLSHKDYDGM